MELTTGVDRDGKILGVHANFVMDGGAYTANGIATAYYSGALLTLTYNFDNYKFDLVRAYTNLPACAAQRGHGAPHPRYALESQLDRIARDLNIDPVEMRLETRESPTRQPSTISCQLLRTESLHRDRPEGLRLGGEEEASCREAEG